MFGSAQRKLELPAGNKALPGRDQPMALPNRHFVHGRPIKPPFPVGSRTAVFGLGCFWGAEKCFWELEGVSTSAVGYAAGATPNPTYQEVCTGLTGHNEVVLVVYDPSVTTYSSLLGVFFESHDPTQGMRQGNDVGTQYRSGIYTFDEDQRSTAIDFKASYQSVLDKHGLGEITTEIIDAPRFYYAEEYHQQYLARNPAGYCGLGGTGISCPVPAR
ncbi:MAG: peptide-methionine (S)-S-oxide reductase MsrA [Pseudomonadota bacterium]|nr:peptide-methionine (S)-S-oxide reductase MsrA [Pseudomonadota bacterium]